MREISQASEVLRTPVETHGCFRTEIWKDVSICVVALPLTGLSGLFGVPVKVHKY